jgi:two-component system catabolic regulation response regulator CreB
MTTPKSIILIVEDERPIADTIQYALETEGFATIRHSVGGNVLPLLSEESIDLIILDIGLPDINGFELCKKIRKHHAVPIIFLTARSDEIDRVVGLEIGADDYIVKPFSPRELSARVKAVLRRTHNSKTASKPQNKISHFRLDESRLQISYYDQILDLSRYEYKMLAIFIKHPEQVFTRDQLMDMAWDEPDVSLDRTVDTHIKNIRGKLKKIRSDDDPIKTHRGTGYSLREDL